MKAQGNKILGAIPDLERVPDLAPDLVWLLGNDRAKVEVLTRTLLSAYGTPISYLARAYLDGIDVAERVVQAIIVQILAGGRHFGGKQDLDVWIFHLVLKNLFAARRRMQIQNHLHKAQKLFAGAEPQDGLEAAIWLGFDELGGRPRMALLLRALFGWGIHEIAEVLDEELRRTRQIIEKAEKHLLRLAHLLGISSQKLPEEGFSLQLDQALQRRWQIEPALQSQLESILPLLVNQVEKRKRHKQLAAYLRQMASVGIPLTLILVVMLAIRWIDPSDEIQHMINPPTTIPTLAPCMHYSAREGDRLEDIAVLLHTSSERLRQANALKDDTLHLGQDLLIPARVEDWSEISQTPLPKNHLPPSPFLTAPRFKMCFLECMPM